VDGGGTEAVSRAVQQAIALGAEEFYVGGYGRFDDTAYEAVSRIKARCPSIRLYRLLAYHPADTQVVLRPGFDGSFYPLDTPPPPQYAIARANRKMIDLSDVLIACVRHPGYASKLLCYAQKRERRGLVHILILP
jgi:hypothetical protein